LATPDPDTRPVLIAYDGSDFAKTAIGDAACQLAAGREAVVLTVREPLEAMSFLGFGSAGVNQDVVDEVTASNESGAEAVSAEGAELARDAGLDARPLVATGLPVWQLIVEAAEDLDAGLIVIGSHGRSGLSFVMLGSVATAVAQHSKRSVMIIHSQP
jgi:nucleotide-binding universal stress UspA family protein